MEYGGFGGLCILEQDVYLAVTEALGKRTLDLAKRVCPAGNNPVCFNQKVNVTATFGVVDAGSKKPYTAFLADNTRYGGLDRLALGFG